VKNQGTSSSTWAGQEGKKEKKHRKNSSVLRPRGELWPLQYGSERQEKTKKKLVKLRGPGLDAAEAKQQARKKKESGVFGDWEK